MTDSASKVCIHPPSRLSKRSDRKCRSTDAQDPGTPAILSRNRLRAISLESAHLYQRAAHELTHPILLRHDQSFRSQFFQTHALLCFGGSKLLVASSDVEQCSGTSDHPSGQIVLHLSILVVYDFHRVQFVLCIRGPWHSLRHTREHRSAY